MRSLVEEMDSNRPRNKIKDLDKTINFKITTNVNGAIHGMKAAGDALIGLETQTKSLNTMIKTYWKGFAGAIGGTMVKADRGEISHA